MSLTTVGDEKERQPEATVGEQRRTTTVALTPRSHAALKAMARMRGCTIGEILDEIIPPAAASTIRRLADELDAATPPAA